MKRDFNPVFDDLVLRYEKVIEVSFLSRYKRAKDKDFIVDELIKETDNVLDWMTASKSLGELIDLFSTRYNRGENIDEILSDLKRIYGDVEEIRPFKKIENGKKISLYISDEERELKNLALDKRRLVRLFIRYLAFRRIKKRLPELFKAMEAQQIVTRNNYPVKWTSKKDNKTEFVQLIYGLHKAGLINEGKGEITKIVESLAEVFKIDLGKGWQANHSSSIHKAKNNYEPAIFENIKAAYKKYMTAQIESERKKH